MHDYYAAHHPRRVTHSSTEEKLLAIALSVGLFVVLIFANLACK